MRNRHTRGAPEQASGAYGGASVALPPSGVATTSAAEQLCVAAPNGQSNVRFWPVALQSAPACDAGLDQSGTSNAPCITSRIGALSPRTGSTAPSALTESESTPVDASASPDAAYGF